MVNTFIPVSSVLLCAVVAHELPGRFGWIRSLFGRRSEKALAVAAPPRIEHLDGGWTMVRCEDIESFQEWLGQDQKGLPPRPGEEPSLGSHLLIELYGCNGEELKYEDNVGEAMKDAARRSEATVVADSFHEFKPWGVSGAVIIQESHYTIHTWPEHRYAAVDLFYCGGTVKVQKAIEVLRERFQPERIKFLVVRRGLQSDVDR